MLYKTLELMTSEWLYLWGDIEDRPDGCPMLEPLVLVDRVLVETRRNVDTNKTYLHIGPRHWSIPIDLLTRGEKHAIPIGTLQKIKL